MAAATSLLDSLTAGSRQHLLDRSTVRRLDDDEYLFHHGDVADCMYVVESGRLAVQTTTSDGDTAIVRVIGPGQVVGELALLVDGLRRTGSVVALGRCSVRVVHRSLFSELRRATRASTAPSSPTSPLGWPPSPSSSSSTSTARSAIASSSGCSCSTRSTATAGSRSARWSWRRWWADRDKRSTACSLTSPRPASSLCAAVLCACSTPSNSPHAGALDRSTVPPMRIRRRASVLLTFGLVLGLLAMGYGVLFSMLDDIRDEYGDRRVGARRGHRDRVPRRLRRPDPDRPARRPGPRPACSSTAGWPSTSSACCCSPRPRRSCRCSPAAS